MQKILNSWYNSLDIVKGAMVRSYRKVHGLANDMQKGYHVVDFPSIGIATMVRSKSPLEYHRTRRIGTMSPYDDLAVTRRPRYIERNTLTHRKGERGMDRWLPYAGK